MSPHPADAILALARDALAKACPAHAEAIAAGRHDPAAQALAWDALAEADLPFGFAFDHLAPGDQQAAADLFPDLLKGLPDDLWPFYARKISNPQPAFDPALEAEDADLLPA